MKIENNISLKKYNTFGIDVYARYFAAFSSTDELASLTADYPHTDGHSSLHTPLVLGGGSNILFRENFDGFAVKNEIRGIEKTGEDETDVYIKVGAGENWHRFVLYCIENNYAGIENLSLIPGNVGASPMQNIGAYGVEIKHVFHSLEAWHLQDNVPVSFTKEACEFGYRESVFKRKYKNQFVITSVTLRLSKKPVFNTRYGAIEQELEAMGVQELSIKAISDAVIRIRQSKLPDPAVIGNAGSFFKNPSVTTETFRKLKEQYPAIVGYTNADGSVKLAAGWLIEQCTPPDAGSVSWKGYRKRDAGCHAKQALVLVNYGNASGEEIYDLSTQIIQSVQDKFRVALEREVNVIL